MRTNSILRKISRSAAAVGLAVAAIAVGTVSMSTEAQAAQGYYRRAPQRDWNRYPGYRTSDSAQTAQQQGYADGAARGRYDRQTGRRTPNPQGHGAYQHGLNGWNREFGNTGFYRQNYRQAFVAGYQDAFFGRRY